MKILWITNITFPEAQLMLDKNAKTEKGGGWLIGAAYTLALQSNINLYIASIAYQVKKLTRLEGESITYYLIPKGKGNTRINHQYDDFWIQIRHEIQPDVVHIHGTEYSHGLSYVESCGTENVVVSIQGLMSICHRYYWGGLSLSKVLRSITPVSLLLGMSIPNGSKDFRIRGYIEESILKKVNHVIGRTSWDRAHVWAINPNTKYHHCGETLRSVFYDASNWDYKKCKPHSIFMSQGSYPLKGLHILLKAMPLILRLFPDTTIRVAGVDVTRRGSLKESLKLTDYGRIIRRLIKKEGLRDKVFFTGLIGEREILKEYLQCNVFLSASSIENSPNSLGEAQLLGVPVVASYVGGVPDMMQGNELNLYRYDDYEMLAYKIVNIFLLEDNINTLLMREEAKKRHDPINNFKDIMTIYNEVSFRE